MCVRVKYEYSHVRVRVRAYTYLVLIRGLCGGTCLKRGGERLGRQRTERTQRLWQAGPMWQSETTISIKKIRWLRQRFHSWKNIPFTTRKRFCCVWRKMHGDGNIR